MGYRKTAPWKYAKQQVLDPVRRLSASMLYKGKIPLAWCRGPNWGDALSPVLVSAIAGKTVVYLNGLHHLRYLSIGSILGSANEYAEVWGSGFIRDNDATIARPRVVHAVRGPLSAARLQAREIECPDVYGDPALLLPRFYNPNVVTRYAVGIVPHYVDKANPWLNTFRNDPQILVLDIESGIGEFVRAVKSCDVILSSSLHGLICADAYGVPNAWISLSNDVIGGNFKFRDYRSSIGADEPRALEVKEHTRLDGLISQVAKHELRIDLRKLLLACPFLSPALRAEVVNATVDSCGLPAKFHSVKIPQLFQSA